MTVTGVASIRAYSITQLRAGINPVVDCSALDDDVTGLKRDRLGVQLDLD